MLYGTSCNRCPQMRRPACRSQPVAARGLLACRAHPPACPRPPPLQPQRYGVPAWAAARFEAVFRSVLADQVAAQVRARSASCPRPPARLVPLV